MTKQRIKQLLPTETFHIDLVYAHDDVSSRRIIVYVKIRSPRCDRSRMGIGKITGQSCTVTLGGVKKLLSLRIRHRIAIIHMIATLEKSR